MASVIRQLADEDLEAVHHMIRRKAQSQLEIARAIEQRLGREISESDDGRQKIVSRYANGRDYGEWLHGYRERDQELKRQLALQRERFELISTLVQGDQDEAFEGVSKAIQARLLALAAEASDEDLKSASGAKGWVATALKLAREFMADRYRAQVEELKAEIKRMLEQPKGKAVDPGAVVRRVDEIMGLSG